MEITPVSVILLVLIACGMVLLNDSPKIGFFLVFLLIVFEFFINTGFFIRTSIRSFSYSEFLSVLCFIWSLYLLERQRLYLRNVIVSLLLFGSIVLGIIELTLIPLEYSVIPFGVNMDLIYWGKVNKEYVSLGGTHFLRLIRVILYFPILFYLGSPYCSKEKLISAIIAFSKYYMVLLSFEFLLKIIGLEALYLDGLNLFFVEVTSGSIERFGLPALFGFTREPSHLAIALFLSGMISIVRGGNDILLILILIFLVLSMSLQCFYAAMLLLTVYLVKKTNENVLRRWKSLAGIAFLSVGIIFFAYESLFTYFFERIESVFNFEDIGVEGVITVGSEGVRIWTVIESFRYFLDRPFLGIGLGTANSYGFISSILSNIGFVGTTLWVYLNIVVLKIKPLRGPLLALILFSFFAGDIGWMYSIISSVFFLSVSNNIRDDSCKECNR